LRIAYTWFCPKIPNAAAPNYFNTFNDNSTGAFNNFNCTFNPIDKVVELYERLLASEREKIELLKKEQ